MYIIPHARRVAAGAIIVILILTVLEFPAPIGFEVRPQDNVSPLWLILFGALMVSQIAAIPFLFKRPRLGAKLGIIAGTLNILQVIADQMHLMQPEVASLAYSMLEYSVAIVSVFLIAVCWSILKSGE